MKRSLKVILKNSIIHKKSTNRLKIVKLRDKVEQCIKNLNKSLQIFKQNGYTYKEEITNNKGLLPKDLTNLQLRYLKFAIFKKKW